jgi:hypothetical protein
LEVHVVITWLRRRPDYGIGDFAKGWDGDGFSRDFAGGAIEEDVCLDFALEMAAEVEGNRDLIAEQAVRGDIGVIQDQVGERFLAADADGVDGDAAGAVLCGGDDGGLAEIPIAIGEYQHGLEVFRLLHRM